MSERVSERLGFEPACEGTPRGADTRLCVENAHTGRCEDSSFKSRACQNTEAPRTIVGNGRFDNHGFQRANSDIADDRADH